MHTHFGSATAAIGGFLSVLVVGTFWRIAWLHALASNNTHARGLARAALTQY